MREILFKAKRIDNGEWVCGFLVPMWGQMHIIDRDFENTAYPIDDSTICQYTGLTDKNGKRIWENDIVRLGEDEDLLIKWSERYAGWCLQQNKWMFEHFFGETVDEGTCEVVGNIFDNPELLKGE